MQKKKNTPLWACLFIFLIFFFPAHWLSLQPKCKSSLKWSLLLNLSWFWLADTQQTSEFILFPRQRNKCSEQQMYLLHSNSRAENIQDYPVLHSTPKTQHSSTFPRHASLSIPFSAKAQLVHVICLLTYFQFSFYSSLQPTQLPLRVLTLAL